MNIDRNLFDEEIARVSACIKEFTNSLDEYGYNEEDMDNLAFYRGRLSALNWIKDIFDYE